MAQIRFGTSGWRGILCEDFVLENVRTVTQAIADHLLDAGIGSRGMVVGNDSRFMGERFAREAATVLAGAEIPVFLCNRDTPTPVISFELLRLKAAGAINFTASHNPAEYNGIKFSPAWGGPALPETTEDIERRANAMLGEICYRSMPFEDALRQGRIREIDPRSYYCETLLDLIDFKAIADSGITVAVNPLYGTARGYLDALLLKAGVPLVTMNDHRDPYFGGFPPEPAQSYIEDFIQRVRAEGSVRLGLATDGDADRYGILDEDGTFIEPNYILALLYDYLLRVRGLGGAAARSVATSHFIDAVANFHGQEVYETPVGFKYIGEFIRDGKILIGGEESAGLTIAGHIPEKDGILACLLVAEMVAVEGRSLKSLLADLYRRVGEFHTSRTNVRLTPELEASLAGKLGDPPSHLRGRKIARLVAIDGVKFFFDDGCWMLFRKSGTEPVVRIYCEAGSAVQLQELSAAARDFVLK